MRMKKWLASLLAVMMLFSMSSFSFAEAEVFEEESEIVEEFSAEEERVLLADAVYRETAFRELNFGAPMSYMSAMAAQASFISSSSAERGRIQYTVTKQSDTEIDADTLANNSGYTEKTEDYPDAVLNVVRNSDSDWSSYALVSRPFNNGKMLGTSAKEAAALRVSASVRVGQGQETYADPTIVGAGLAFGSALTAASHSQNTFKDPYLKQSTNAFGKQTLTFLVGAVDATVGDELQKAGEWLRVFGGGQLIASVKLDTPVDIETFVTFDILQVATYSDAGKLNGCNIYVTVGGNTVVLNCPVAGTKQNVSVNGTATTFSIYNNTGKGMGFAQGAGFLASYTESSLDYFRMSILDAVENDGASKLQGVETNIGVIELDSDIYPDGMDLQNDAGFVINKYVGANDSFYGAEKTPVDITECNVYPLDSDAAYIDDNGIMHVDYVGSKMFILEYEQDGVTAQTFFKINVKSRLTPLIGWIDTLKGIDLNAMIPQVPLSFEKFWTEEEENATLAEIIAYAEEQAEVRPIISQEEIDEIVTNLENIYNNLPLATIWKKAVLKATSVDSYYAYDYTEDSFAAVMAAKEALVEEINAAYPADDTMTDLMAAVDEAIAGLVSADHSQDPAKPEEEADSVEIVMGATQIPGDGKTSFRVFSTYIVDGSEVVYDVTSEASASASDNTKVSIFGNTISGKNAAGTIVLTITYGTQIKKVALTLLNKEDFVPQAPQNHLYDRHSLTIDNGDAFAITVGDVVIPSVTSVAIDKKDTTEPYVTFIVADETIARYESSIGAIRGLKEGKTYVIAKMPTLQRDVYSLPVVLTVSESGVQAEYTEENGYIALSAAAEVAENYSNEDLNNAFAQMSALYGIEIHTDGANGNAFFREIEIMKNAGKEINADAAKDADVIVSVLLGIAKAAETKKTSDIIDVIEPNIKALGLDMKYFKKLELAKFKKAAYTNLLEAYIDSDETIDSDKIRAMWLDASEKAYEDEKNYEPVKSTSGKGGGGGGGNFSFNVGIPTIVTPQDAFPDIASVTWAKDAINGLAKKNIIAGYPDGEYKPNNLVTRDEFAKLVVEVFGYKEMSGIRFEDIPADGWQVSYVDRAATGGVVLGIGNNAFGSGANITHQDACVMIYRAIQKKGYTLKTKSGKVEFSDAEAIAAYAQESVNAMNNAGLFAAMTEGQFMPETACTRAMVAYLLYGAMQNLGL